MPLPASLEELLSTLGDEDNFGRVDNPERALRTPAIKAYTKAGGTHQLNKKEPLPEGFHVIKVRASLSAFNTYIAATDASRTPLSCAESVWLRRKWRLGRQLCHMRRVCRVCMCCHVCPG